MHHNLFVLRYIIGGLFGQRNGCVVRRLERIVYIGVVYVMKYLGCCIFTGRLELSNGSTE